jgi:citrate lyase subunit beta/citryl-CoA lyase
MLRMKACRSVLYMPASNERALEKAPALPADAFIIDLEDAVAPAEKLAARERVRSSLKDLQHFKNKTVAVRVNGLDTDWGRGDIDAVLETAVSTLVLPKVESPAQIEEVLRRVPVGRDIELWLMLETPDGVVMVDELAACAPEITALVMGTSDLAMELHVPVTADRLGLLYSLSRCVCAARANNLLVIDGVFVDLQDEAGYLAVCEQGKQLGFDGKSLIHPKQLENANRVFSPAPEEIERAKKVIAAWTEANERGEGVVLVDGKLVENLHVAEAQRVLALAALIE